MAPKDNLIQHFTMCVCVGGVSCQRSYCTILWSWPPVVSAPPRVLVSNPCRRSSASGTLCSDSRCVYCKVQIRGNLIGAFLPLGKHWSQALGLLGSRVLVPSTFPTTQSCWEANELEGTPSTGMQCVSIKFLIIYPVLVFLASQSQIGCSQIHEFHMFIEHLLYIRHRSGCLE